MQQNNNLVAEIGLIILSALIVIGAVVLLVLGKTDYAETAGLVGAAVALWGGNLLYKAPSPTQQTTLVQALIQKPNQAQPPIVIHNNIPSAPAPIAPVQVPLDTRTAVQFTPPGASTTNVQLSALRHFGDSQFMPVVPPGTPQ